MAWSAELDTSSAVKSAEDLTDALVRMKKAAQEAGAATESAGKKTEKSGAAPAKKAKTEGRRKKDEKKPGLFSRVSDYLFGGKDEKEAKPKKEPKKKPTVKAPKEEKPKAEKKGAAGSKAGAGASGIGGKIGGAALAGAGVAGASLAATLGVAGGVIDLGKIIAGQRAMAKFDSIVARTQMSFKALFKGADAGPMLRALERLTYNFSGQSSMGKLVGKVLTDAFNMVGRAIEKVEPIASAAMKGVAVAAGLAELGGLKVYGAWLKLRLALKPYIGDIGNLVSKSTALNIAFYTTATVAGVMAASMLLASAPFLVLGGAIYGLVAAGQRVHSFFSAFAASPLFAAISNAFSSAFDVVGNVVNKALGVAGQAVDAVIAKIKAAVATVLEIPIIGDALKAVGSAASTAVTAVSGAASSVGTSVSTLASSAGKSIDSTVGSFVTGGGHWGEGLVSGIDAKEGAIYEAGMRASKAAIKGAKAGAEIRSPSRKMRREVGQQMGEGTALGMEDKETRIQKSAASSMVPDTSILGSVGKGGKGSVSITSPLIVLHVEHFGGSKDEYKAMRQFFDEQAQHVAEAIGLGTT